MSQRTGTVVFLALALSCPAQIFSLATTDDGSVVLMDATARFAGANDGPQGKIFRWDGKFSLVFSERVLYRNGYGAYGALLSGDGSVYGFGFSEGCSGSCSMNWPQTTYYRNGVRFQASGGLSLSHNGRYAGGSPTWQGPLVQHRIDLVTGQTTLLTNNEDLYGFTDEGRALLGGRSGLRMAAPNLPDIVVTTATGVVSASVSADGSRVLYVVRRDDYVELKMGEEILAVCQGPRTVCAGYSAVLSNDGRRALIRERTTSEGPWAWWIDLETRKRQELGPLGSFAATLSGDGRVAWLFDRNRQLVRVRLDTGEREVISEPLLVLASDDLGSKVRGSRIRVYGSGFGADPAALRLTLVNDAGSVEWPVLEANETYFDFQIPWLLASPFQFGSVGIGRRDSMFEAVARLYQLERVQPNYWIEPDAPRVDDMPLIKAAHGDYRGLVTAADPARPGEVVHVYMTGLGPASPPQQDLTPAPSDPPAKLADPITCEYGRAPARIEFAGLAPGMIGVYLVSVEMPRAWTGPPQLRCWMFESGGQRGPLGYLPVSTR